MDLTKTKVGFQLDSSSLERGEFCKLSGGFIEYFIFKIVEN